MIEIYIVVEKTAMCKYHIYSSSKSGLNIDLWKIDTWSIENKCQNLLIVFKKLIIWLTSKNYNFNFSNFAALPDFSFYGIQQFTNLKKNYITIFSYFINWYLDHDFDNYL